MHSSTMGEEQNIIFQNIHKLWWRFWKRHRNTSHP